jgi:hypothetical protein
MQMNHNAVTSKQSIAGFAAPALKGFGREHVPPNVCGETLKIPEKETPGYAGH